jgi:hypothetical protein
MPSCSVGRSNHVAALRACGVPDHGLDRLADELAAVIADERIPAAVAEDALAPSHAELRELLNASQRCSAASQNP